VKSAAQKYREMQAQAKMPEQMWEKSNKQMIVVKTVESDKERQSPQLWVNLKTKKVARSEAEARETGESES
jgi:hypothetical protein